MDEQTRREKKQLKHADKYKEHDYKQTQIHVSVIPVFWSKSFGSVIHTNKMDM